jgi:hypothetical protein
MNIPHFELKIVFCFFSGNKRRPRLLGSGKAVGVDGLVNRSRDYFETTDWYREGATFCHV